MYTDLAKLVEPLVVPPLMSFTIVARLAPASYATVANTTIIATGRHADVLLGLVRFMASSRS